MILINDEKINATLLKNVETLFSCMCYLKINEKRLLGLRNCYSFDLNEQ